MKHQLNQEQRLTWKMTQKLSQAIEILAYNGQDLVRFLQDQAEANPLIELSVTSPMPSMGAGGQGFKSPSPAVGAEAVQEKSFHDHLRDQLVDAALSEPFRGVVQYGVDSLNEHGYLEVSLEEWSAACGVATEEVEQALSVIQTFHPAGVGARTLQECIVLQLKRMGKPIFMMQLVYDHIEWIAEQSIDLIEETYRVSNEEALEAVEAIQSCHPRPGLQYAPVQQEYIVPDGEVFKKDGEWQVKLSPWNTPDLLIDEEMYAISEQHQEAMAFLEEKYEHAKWLKMAIEQRKENMKEIIEVIVRRQENFFEKGSLEMQTLRMREVAEETGVHVSTISRAVRNKYIQCPQGILPLKHFFQQGLKMKNGAETPTHSIKHLIKETIQSEDRHHPYSDQKLSQLLYDQFGIYISRRTVAKYREALYIPSSTKRKQRG